MWTRSAAYVTEGDPLRGKQRLGPTKRMARPERFELPTPWFVARYSIQLSYGRVSN